MNEHMNPATLNLDDKLFRADANDAVAGHQLSRKNLSVFRSLWCSGVWQALRML